MKRLLLTTVLALAGAFQPALAEKADRDQPVNIEADRLTVDDRNKVHIFEGGVILTQGCLLYTSPSPRDRTRSRMPSSA